MAEIACAAIGDVESIAGRTDHRKARLTNWLSDPKAPWHITENCY